MFYNESWKPYLFCDQKIKVHSRESVSVFRQKAVLPLAAYYVSRVRFTCCNAAMLVIPGFPCVTRSRCCCRPPVFPCVEFFYNQPTTKAWPVWVMVVLWVLAASSIINTLLLYTVLCFNGNVDRRRGEAACFCRQSIDTFCTACIGEWISQFCTCIGILYLPYSGTRVRQTFNNLYLIICRRVCQFVWPWAWLTAGGHATIERSEIVACNNYMESTLSEYKSPRKRFCRH